MQVAGLLINSGNGLSLEDAYIATAIETVSISAGCDLSKERLWRVYAIATQLSPSKMTADIFVLDKDGSLLITMIDINFSRLPLRQIERSLANANKTSSRTARSTNGTSTSLESGSSQLTMTPRSSSPPNEMEKHEANGGARSQDSPNVEKKWPQNREDLTSLMAEVLGTEKCAMEDSATLGSLGFDSLSLSELKYEIKEMASCQFDLNVEMTIAHLHGQFTSGGDLEDSDEKLPTKTSDSKYG